jgi:transglutaminase-like putative cysteine protease
MKFKWWLVLFFICSACTSTENNSAKGINLPASNTTIVDTRQYFIKQKISLVNTGDRKPEKQNLWVALIHDVYPYQEVLSRSISPGNYTLLTDEYGNQYAEFDLSDHPAGTTILIELEYQVTVNEVIYDLSDCKGELPDTFIHSELHIESANPQIISLAKDLSKGKRTACEQIRAFYDYAGDKLIYSYNRNAWGAQATFGLMGADCSEYASLMIALSRAEKIPARYYEGLLYLEDAEKKKELAQIEHAWLDTYLPNAGWVAMDPTLGRSQIFRETYFAHYIPNHIIVTTGRNPSTLRGASYWSHLYWPGKSTTIQINNSEWVITPVQNE